MRERIRWDLTHALNPSFTASAIFGINEWMTFVLLEITKLGDFLWPWMKSDGRRTTLLYKMTGLASPGP
jgi:hypothetical protein